MKDVAYGGILLELPNFNQPIKTHRKTVKTHFHFVNILSWQISPGELVLMLF